MQKCGGRKPDSTEGLCWKIRYFGSRPSFGSWGGGGGGVNILDAMERKVA